MSIHLNVNGSWREGDKVYVRVAGSWVEADELFVKQAGVWHSAWKNAVVFVNTYDRTAASIFELMGSPTKPGTYIFENRATISAGTGSYALRTGVFPAGSILKIVNKGYIRGRGGAGGAFNGAGGAGGTALYIDMNCTLDNGAGYIYGGGGGGGGAQWYWDSGWYVRTGGGGGAGAIPGAAGSPNSRGDRSGTLTINTPCSAGTAGTGGNGGVARAELADRYNEVRGGAGGGPGTAGQASSSSQLKGNKGDNPQHYSGGAAGAAIARNGKTVSITAGNDTNRIKGAVV